MILGVFFCKRDMERGCIYRVSGGILKIQESTQYRRGLLRSSCSVTEGVATAKWETERKLCVYP